MKKVPTKFVKYFSAHNKKADNKEESMQSIPIGNSISGNISSTIIDEKCKDGVSQQMEKYRFFGSSEKTSQPQSIGCEGQTTGRSSGAPISSAMMEEKKVKAPEKKQDEMHTDLKLEVKSREIKIEIKKEEDQDDRLEVEEGDEAPGEQRQIDQKLAEITAKIQQNSHVKPEELKKDNSSTNEILEVPSNYCTVCKIIQVKFIEKIK